MKKELFRGVTECLVKGGMTIEQIAKYCDNNQKFVKCEIERIKQCGPFKDWVIYRASDQTYSITNYLKGCPLESIIYLIKYFYNIHKDNMDMKMHYQKKTAVRHETTVEDYYNDLEKYFTNGGNK